MANTTQQLKLADGHHLAKRTEELYTADPQRNGLIHIGDDTAFPDPLQRVFKELPPDLAGKAREVYLTEARRLRRIDYLWMESFFPGLLCSTGVIGNGHR